MSGGHPEASVAGDEPQRIEPLRIGLLGAARISETSLVKPALATGVRLVAVAARSRERAEAFAARHGVERVLDSYADVIADSDVEAVYNPLANSLHAAWNVAALEAGKHVLTEKPSASNHAEASWVRERFAATSARFAGQVFMEGFHYVYHPMFVRLLEIVASGEVGEVRHVESTLLMPAPDDSDPRWDLALAGGAIMDLGCYALHAQRVLGAHAGGAPVVTGARGEQHSPGVDAWADVEVAFPGGATGLARCSMTSGHWEMAVHVHGTRGSVSVPDLLYREDDDRVVVRASPEAGGAERVEHGGTDSTYTHQLRAFTAAVRHGAAVATDADDAVATMALVDDAYRALGLAPRPSAPRSAPVR
ncbi:Gfo/Idh/MocA family protein [Nocardioides bruguierae]|uniref:Gfo/Idh/MocA family protein n=1 Tax=Nocardioides bruguierae TaxID=2945102 RepID=UPI002021ED22|nr:Gfo/Idh/MocA family oxidoreductase [Nocardioides bruguierae]MCL8024262.1 Gfo/Idh/MocA family oxidoreductase [Nocardioides bruguierae]